ncbi:MAG: sigma-70 family RNA polymerase sigma factor [Acidimicrobiales bacterium]
MIGSVLVTLTDADLLDLVRRGDESAFTELYTRHRDVAQRMASTYCRSGEADDLVDVAFEKVLGALRRGSGPTGAFRAYLFVTLRRLAAEQAERPREWPVDELPEPLAAAHAMPTPDAAERDLITGAFETLPGRWQAVLWHTAVEGRHPRELASVLGMSANAVSALAYRARERLRQAYLQAHLQAAPRPACEPHRSSLGAYVRDGQNARERQATVEHLERCRSCQALVAELLDVNRSLARAVLPMVVTASAGTLDAVLASSAVVSEVGTAAKRSLTTWARMHSVRGVVGGVAASSALLFGVTHLRPHFSDDRPQPPAVDTTVDDAPDGGAAAVAGTTVVDPMLASRTTPCPVGELGGLGESSPGAAAGSGSSDAGTTTATTVPGLISSVLEPVIAGLSPTTTVPPGSATLTEVVCTLKEPGRGDLTVVVTGAGDVLDTGDQGTDLGSPLGEVLPVDAKVTIDLTDGARVALEAGLPDACEVAPDRQSLICTIDTLLPGALSEATVGLEVDAPPQGAPSATVTLSEGDQPIATQTLDLSPVTDLLTPPPLP